MTEQWGQRPENAIRSRQAEQRNEGEIMNFETMRYESDGDLIRLTLNRPEALNAVNLQGAVELHQAAQAIHDDETARAVIIRGKGGPSAPAST